MMDAAGNHARKGIKTGERGIVGGLIEEWHAGEIELAVAGKRLQRIHDAYPV